MSSLAMRLLAAGLRRTRKRPVQSVDGARKRLHAPKDDPAPPLWFTRRHRVDRRSVGGFDSYTVLPAHGEPARSVLYVHGGSYVSEISPWHWVMVAHIVDEGFRVEVPIYGLAPEHTHREAFGFLVAVYRELLAYTSPERTVFAGDSAGAGLILALTQSLAEQGLPRPARLLLISPWVDLTMSHPDIPLIEVRDPWLSPVWLSEAARAWAGGDDLDLPALSPVNGPLADLPPVDLYIGTADVFHPDTRRLNDMIALAGATSELYEEEGAIHVFPLVPSPEGRRARARILRTLRTV